MDHNVTEVLMAISIIGGFGTSVILFAKTITNYILKKKMIDKGFVNDETQAIFKEYTQENKFASLKWGLIILFGGISLIIMSSLEYENTSPLPYGIFSVSVSLGFLIYYFLVRRDLKN